MSTNAQEHTPLPPPEWLDYLMEEEWNALCEFLFRSGKEGIRTLLGGGLGLSAYMPLRRRTKDLDFYIHPSDRERTIALLSSMGFEDLHDRLPYDRRWIYRSFQGEVIIDIIWQFANHLDNVDEKWFSRAPRFPLDGLSVSVVPPEELLRAKLFVVQRERCDWPDLLNLIHHTHDRLDRDFLRKRLGEHAPLFDSLLLLYEWLCPDGKASPTPSPDAPTKPARADLLDSRPWFLPRTSL